MRILGLNHSNDSAAALVHEGRVVAAAAEERFSRKKHDSSFPNRAMAWALAEGAMTVDECDAIAFFWNPVRQMDAPHSRWVAQPRTQLEYLYSLPNQLFGQEDLSALPYVELRVPLPSGDKRLLYITHHLCHAAHAFFDSPFPRAAILTVDGYGERASTTISRGVGGAIKPLWEAHFPHSVGAVYAALTEYLGFQANNGEGKVMGLASYGQPHFHDVMEDLLRITEDGFEVDLSYVNYYMDRPTRYSERLVSRLGPPREAEGAIEERHQHIAASLQMRVEEVLVHLAKLARKKTGESNLCMAGGVVLNCVANERVARESGFDEVFFQPACHDAGTSAGAALYAAQVLLGDGVGVRPEVKTDYLGPQYDADALRRAIDFAGVSFRECKDPNQETAEQLARGRIVGRFAGRAEFGPRALGNRSILAAPGPSSVKDVLNARVKRRESFRPFAPSVPEAMCGELFDRSEPSPFMIRAYRTKAEHLDALGAITHVDGSARVQTVSKAQNGDYAALIEAYGKASGIPCVLNTSFNVRGEPIVNTPEDALRCFFSTGMDALLLGPYLVEK
ncbi:MAG: hypothetical protein JRH20_12325 [Deltaproteobacteria bacterium]|nr:hypothetical protein [Deltaproteobacteria bacterium]